MNDFDNEKFVEAKAHAIMSNLPASLRDSMPSEVYDTIKGVVAHGIISCVNEFRCTYCGEGVESKPHSCDKEHLARLVAVREAVEELHLLEREFITQCVDSAAKRKFVMALDKLRLTSGYAVSKERLHRFRLLEDVLNAAWALPVVRAAFKYYAYSLKMDAPAWRTSKQQQE